MSFLQKLFGGGSRKEFKSVPLAGLSEEEKKAKIAEVSAETGIPVFEPRPISTAYSRSYNMSTTEAPEVEDELVQHYAEFIYATDGRPKIACLPAGYFAPNDPVVVIDERMIAAEAPEGVEFQGIIGIQSEKGTILFRQYDNQPAHYIRDDNKQVVRMRLLEPGEEPPKEKNKGRIEPGHEAQKRARKKKRMARKSRKRNRKK